MTGRAPLERLTYSVPEAAQALGVSDKHLRNLITAGKMPYIRLGTRLLIRRATLEQLLAEQEQIGIAGGRKEKWLKAR
jgi:excisionase family DNA binding protein